MFGLFKRKSKQEKLMNQYRKLQKEAYYLAEHNKAESDAKYAEAEVVMRKIEELINEGD